MVKVFCVFLLVLVCFSHLSLSTGSDKNSNNAEENANLEDFGLEYGRYLQQVVQALEQDTAFAKRLENVSYDEIKSGNVAKELEFVQHNVRSKLDELKRVEIDRLRALAQKELELKQGLYRGEDGRLMDSASDERRWRTIKHPSGAFQGKNMPNHLDSMNPHTFEVDDLRKLIQSANKDLEEIDKRRKKEFKRYEMEKELQYRNSLVNLTEEERKEVEKKHEELKKKHQDHPAVHHPGSKKQLEQVWEEQDNLPKEEFNPDTFFAMHDANQDGYLDEQEVESILSIEIKKLYDPSHNPDEDDAVEMMEEYNRMREHIYLETDKDKDRLISKQEFLDMTKKDAFNKDEGWKDLDEQTLFSENELKEFEHDKLEQQNVRKGEDKEKYHPISEDKGKLQYVPLPYQAKLQDNVQATVPERAPSKEHVKSEESPKVNVAHPA